VIILTETPQHVTRTEGYPPPRNCFHANGVTGHHGYRWYDRSARRPVSRHAAPPRRPYAVPRHGRFDLACAGRHAPCNRAAGGRRQRWAHHVERGLRSSAEEPGSSHGAAVHHVGGPCRDTSRRSSAAIWSAVFSASGSPAFSARATAKGSSSPYPARDEARARRVTVAIWRRLRPISSITSSRRCWSASGISVSKRLRGFLADRQLGRPGTRAEVHAAGYQRRRRAVAV